MTHRVSRHPSAKAILLGGVWVGSGVSEVLAAFWATVAGMWRNHDDRAGYWRETLFIASATHGEIPWAAKGW
jgi:hypothetical protein